MVQVMQEFGDLIQDQNKEQKESWGSARVRIGLASIAATGFRLVSILLFR
jgi:hypothetical protein